VSVIVKRYGLSTRYRLPVEGSTHLYLVRHGQTEANVRHQLAGHTDVPLDALGQSQARQVGERMRSEALQAIITSPLQRARHTAEAIGQHHALVPHEDHRLKEMHFGVAEGLTLSEAGVLHPEILTLLKDPTIADYAWPGGDRRSDFHARVFTAFTDIAQRHRDQSLAVVAHGGVISSIVAQLDGGSPNDYETYQIANCSVTHLEVTHHGIHLHRVNDITHLDVVRTEPFTYADPTTLVHAVQQAAGGSA
jgi:broad specificity phosphatase PhoE